MAALSLLRSAAVVVTTTLLPVATAWSQAPIAPCPGNEVTVQRGDTLSRIAQHCDVAERAILAANPAVQGSGDLQVGATLKLGRGDQAGAGLASKVRDFVGEADEEIRGVADKFGSSVQDLLDKNPDLKSRLDRVGKTIGLTNGSGRPDVSITPNAGAPGSTVTVSATGLPKEVTVTIAAGPPGSAHEIITQARASPSGTLDAHVQVPPSAAQGSSLVFIIKTGETVQARSGAFRVRS